MSEHQPPEHNSDQNPAEQEARLERQQELHPRIWIGSLADYNNGTLTGDWVYAAVDDDELVNAAKRIVASSETPDAEEYAIFDYDEFGDFKVGEYEQLSLVAKVARGIAEHGSPFAFWADLHDADPDMLDAYEDSYLGEYESADDWAKDVLDGADIDRRLETEFGEHIARYIRPDYEAFARDAWLSGDIYVAHKDGGGVWIYSAA